MPLMLDQAQARLDKLRRGYAEKQADFERARLDLAAQEGAIQDAEWVVDQLRNDPIPKPQKDAAPTIRPAAGTDNPKGEAAK